VSTSTSPQPLSWSPHGPITAIVSAPGHDVVTDNDAAPGLEQDFGRDGEQGGRPPRDSLEVLRGLFAERAELPVPAVRDDTRPLDELHLSSIAVGEIMNRAARDLGVAVPALTSGYATSTLAELAMTLDDLAGTQLPDDAAGGQWQPPPGVAAWTRAFAVELVPAPALAPPRALAGAEGEWRVLATPGHPLAGPLSAALRTAGLGGGVLLLLPRECGEEHVPLMLEAAQAALRDGSQRFVVVQDERGAAALAKTLHLEAPSVRTTVIVLRLEEGMATDGIVASITNDVAATTAFSEVHYDDAGRRLVPVLRPVPGLADRDPNRDFPSAGVRFGPRDVVLATGGGKGITAECALALARHSGAALAIVGRSDPGHDAELAANLRRMSSAGARVQYFQADVTSASAMRSAVAQIQDALVAVTAVMHGAGHNRPVPLGSLSEEDFQATLAPKAGGLDAVLAAVDPSAIRLLVNFGSIIGRAGLRGQADYATANDWLTIRTREFQAQYPECRCVALEWSVWAGAGMGERLGVVESLAREGITPIPVDAGIDLLLAAIAAPGRPTALVIMGRLAGLPTLTIEQRELPLQRFTDHPVVSYPGIELVTEAELSLASDPYLADHELDGDLLFPAVLGMEAMAQVASALLPDWGALTFEKVEFPRPVVVQPAGTTAIRIAALLAGDSVDVVIRSSETGFHADHFRATVRSAGSPRDCPDRAGPTPDSLVPLDPADLYGSVLFQGKRFRRLLEYQHLSATSCVARIAPGAGDEWFGSYLPGGMLLGDPGTRDAFMHAIQCCVPDAILLPVGIDQVYLTTGGREAGPLTLRAVERARDGNAYTYDLDVVAADGQIAEQWTGLRLHAVRRGTGDGPWLPALLGPYIEGQARDLIPNAPRCAVEPDWSLEPASGTGTSEARRARTAAAISRLLGRPAEVAYRGDGRPEVVGDETCVSASHGAGVTFAVAAQTRVCCDVETVNDRTAEQWQDLLGESHLELAMGIARTSGDDPAVAATRVWGAVECLRKAGWAVPGPITHDGPALEGWVLLRAGNARIATFRTRLRNHSQPVVFTILIGGENNAAVLRVSARGRLRGNQPRRKRLLRQPYSLAGPMPGDVPVRTGTRGHRGTARRAEALHDQV
jgi:enediyne polyketide synthase